MRSAAGSFTGNWSLLTMGNAAGINASATGSEGKRTQAEACATLGRP